MSAVVPSKSFYTFEQALDARFRISCENNKNSENILSAVYIHKDDFPLLKHSHNFYEINIIINGSGMHFIEDNRLPTQTGDVFVIPPNLAHGYSEDKDGTLEILHILLSERFMREYGGMLRGTSGYSLLFNVEPQLRKNVNVKLFAAIDKSEFVFYLHEFNKLISFCRGDMTTGEYETNKNAKILNLLCDLAATLTANTNALPKESALNVAELLRVIAYIDENYAENITLADLCAVSNMSRSSLLNQFSRLYNCSPSVYLLNTRLENACKMLEQSQYSIAQIAQDCGFYDSSHFSKMFCKVKKMLPKEYRHSIKTH